jgi:D-alanyl-D-alanine carboxypeptidase (penicillin-binding protein 5/6)
MGPIGTSGGNAAVPMASTAKIMTALLVLEDHPLNLNEPGPVLTVSRSDVNIYISQRNQNESVVPVVAGEQLSEYQLLQGLMLPSASNFAVMLATWDKGSVAAFVARMNARAAELGMTVTHYADASGFAPQSVSTPTDLITVSRTAMRIPVFAQIVSQPQASLPVAGVIHNLNTLLGRNGVIGIKTGHTDQAGGCFVFAADFTIDGQPVRIYGAVVGQPNFLAGAFAAATSLLTAVHAAVHLRSVLSKGQPVGRYSAAWGETGPIVASSSVNWVLVDGTQVTKQARFSSLAPGMPGGSRGGILHISAGSRQADVSLITQLPINGPDLGWRLTRGF